MFNITIIGLTLLAVFIFFILQKKVLHQADYALLGINLFQAAFLITGYWVSHSLHTTSFVLQTSISFLLFPTFSLYALLLSATTTENLKKWWWFWISPITSVFIVCVDFHLQDYDQDALQIIFENPPILYLILYKFNQIFIIGACFWLLARIKKYKNTIRELFSNIEAIRLEWLKQFTFMMMGINIITLIVFVAYNFHWIEHIDIPYAILNIAYVIALFFLSINGIKQYSLIELKDLNNHENNQTIKSTPEEKNIAPSDISATYQPLYLALKKLIEEEKLFLDPQLQVQQVAEKLQVNSHKISKAINSNYGKPFFDLINSYRITHLKALLIDPSVQHLTILALGLDSGFNSKASLNRIFKQHTGITPRAYQKNQITRQIPSKDLDN